MKIRENERKPKLKGTITITPFLVGRPPPGKWFSSLRLCGGSGLGEKKTLNTSVVGIIRVGAWIVVYLNSGWGGNENT